MACARWSPRSTLASRRPAQSEEVVEQSAGRPVARAAGLSSAAVRRGLRSEDVAALLAAPKCATLATYRRDGTVLLSPVWHEWRDGGFHGHPGPGGVKPPQPPADPPGCVGV